MAAGAIRGAEVGPAKRAIGAGLATTLLAAVRADLMRAVRNMVMEWGIVKLVEVRLWKLEPLKFCRASGIITKSA